MGTHWDIEPRKFYYTNMSTLTYVHERSPKGRAINLKVEVPLPKDIAVTCGPCCELLKGDPKCSLQHHETPVFKAEYSSAGPSMVSYVFSTLHINVQRDGGSYFAVRTMDATSRSIGGYINLDMVNETRWDSPSLTEEKNDFISNLGRLTAHALSATPSVPHSLVALSSTNMQKANALYSELLAKLVSPSMRNASLHPVDNLGSMKNYPTFLAALGGVTDNYNHYSTFPPDQTATINQLVLAIGARKYPELVREIKACYERVDEARRNTPAPFKYQPRIVENAILRGLRSLPTKQEDGTPIPLPVTAV